MPPRASVFEVSNIGLELVPGTPVAATKKLSGTQIKPSIKAETKQSGPTGSRFNTVSALNKEWSEASVDQEVATYVDPAYIFANALGMPTIANLGSGAYSQTYDLSSFFALTPKTWTVEAGSSVRAMQLAYGLMTDIGMTYSRNNGVGVSGKMIGQRITDAVTLTPGTNEVQTLTMTGTPTGGTVTLVFMGETTATIVWNAASSAVLSALEALPNIDVGDITVGGGPWPGSAITVTFRGKFAGQNIGLISLGTNGLSGGTTPSLTVAETTPGVPLSETSVVPISGNEWDLFIDPTSGAIGTTKVVTPLEAGWSLGGLYGPIWAGNTSFPSYQKHVDLMPTSDFSFKVEADAAGMAFRANLQAGSTIYAQLRCTGPLVGGAITYLNQVSLAAKITEPQDYEDADGLYAIGWKGQIMHDATYQKAMSILLRNNLAAL